MIFFLGGAAQDGEPEDDPQQAIELQSNAQVLHTYGARLVELEAEILDMEQRGLGGTQLHIIATWKLAAIRGRVESIRHTMKYVRN